MGTVAQRGDGGFVLRLPEEERSGGAYRVTHTHLLCLGQKAIAVSWRRVRLQPEKKGSGLHSVVMGAECEPVTCLC